MSKELYKVYKAKIFLKAETVELPFSSFCDSLHFSVPHGYLEAALYDKNLSQEEKKDLYGSYTDGTDWAGYRLEIARAYADWFLRNALGNTPAYEVELLENNNHKIRIIFYGSLREFKDFKPLNLTNEELLLMSICAVFGINLDNLGDLAIPEIEDIFHRVAKSNGVYNRIFFNNHHSKNRNLLKYFANK